MLEFSAKEIYGTVFSNCTATFLARIVDESGISLTISDINSVNYTIYLLDDQTPTTRTAVTGHEQISLQVSSVMFNTLQTNRIWSMDTTGYNFRHTLDTDNSIAFPIPNRYYLIVYQIVPANGVPINIHFRVNAI